MPIYEYRCDECGFQKEFLQRMSDAPLKDCPACGKPALTKLLSAAGFQLKGTGWYATDFKNSSKPATKTAASAEKTADKPADSAKPAEASTSTKETSKSEAPSGSSTTSAS